MTRKHSDGARDKGRGISDSHVQWDGGFDFDFDFAPAVRPTATASRFEDVQVSLCVQPSSLSTANATRRADYSGHTLWIRDLPSPITARLLLLVSMEVPGQDIYSGSLLITAQVFCQTLAQHSDEVDLRSLTESAGSSGRYV